MTANGMSMGVSLRLANDGAMEVIGDRSRSDPRHYDELSHSSIPEILLSFRMPVFQNEGALSVGFLTAAYGLWFKSFGYSWVLQKALKMVMAQILNPEQNIISWNYLIEVNTREIKNPRIGLAKVGGQIFPCALIYDHLILLPSAKEQRPTQRAPISCKAMDAQRIEPRFRHCCHGPSSLICDGQDIISPDMFPNTTVPIEQIRCEVWSWSGKC